MRRAIPAICFWAAACGDAADICDASALTAALAQATAGTTVQLGACRITGTFDVPSGVIIRGRGSQTELVAPADRPALALLPGASTTELRDLEIIAAGVIGLLARGDAAALLSNVAVELSRGVGLGFQDLRRLELQSVSIDGTGSTDPSFGLVVLRVQTAQLTSLSLSRLTRYGAIFLEGATTLSGGQVSDSVNVGLLMYGGMATVRGLTVANALRGTGAEPALGVVFAGGIELDVLNLDVADSDDYGLLIDDASGVLVDLAANGNNSSGLRIQNSAGLSVSGSFSENGRAAISAHDSTGVVLQNTTIENTRARTTLIGGQPYDVGDGIHFVRSSTGARFANLTLQGNERAGVLIELDGATLEPATFAGVSVTTSSTAYGAIVQGGVIPPGWDANVMRLGTAAANDATLTRRLETLEGVGPCWMPAADVLTNGLMALIGF